MPAASLCVSRLLMTGAEQFVLPLLCQQYQQERDICLKFTYCCIYCVWFVIVQIEIDIEPTDKVERIKERVEEKEGIPPQQQRLIFSGKQM